MKYEFVLTDKMKEDRFMCGKDDNICEECSCHMGNSDCVFNHLYVTAEQEHDIDEDFNSETGSRKVTKISELLKIAKPKPCPFCGYWNISDGSYSTRYSCACMSCGARTQETETWKEAVELWNAGQFQNRKIQIKIEDELKDLSKRVENIEKQMKEDKEAQLEKLKAELEYAKFRCALPTIQHMMGDKK